MKLPDKRKSFQNSGMEVQCNHACFHTSVADKATFFGDRFLASVERHCNEAIWLLFTAPYVRQSALPTDQPIPGQSILFLNRVYLVIPAGKSSSSAKLTEILKAVVCHTGGIVLCPMKRKICEILGAAAHSLGSVHLGDLRGDEYKEKRRNSYPPPPPYYRAISCWFQDRSRPKLL